METFDQQRHSLRITRLGRARVPRSGRDGPVGPPLRADYGVIFETKVSELPNCGGQTSSGAGFDAAGPLPSKAC
jgi:hypothetical protein